MLAPMIAIRYQYMRKWSLDWLRDRNAPLVPASLYCLADCIHRSGRLDEVARIYQFVPAYESSKNPISLAQQLFKAIVKYCQTATYLRPECGSYFDEESEFIARNVAQFNIAFGKTLCPQTCVGIALMAEVSSDDKILQPITLCSLVREESYAGTTYASPHERGLSGDGGNLLAEWPLYHLSRGMGRGSSAASKYFCIFCSGYYPRSTPSVVCCMADGCGGVLALLLHMYPHAKGVYNSLVDQDLHSLQEPMVYTPSALLGCDLLNRVTNLRYAAIGSTDINLSTTRDRLKRYVTLAKDSEENLVLYTMDAETTDEQSWSQLLASTMDVVRATTNFLAVIKLILPMCDRDESLTGTITQILGTGNWNVTKPLSSYSENCELFIVVSSEQRRLQSGRQDISAEVEANRSYSLISGVPRLLRLGVKLSLVSRCLDITKQNFEELFGKSPERASCKYLFKRAVNILSARWEVIERDPYYIELLKRSGREAVLLDMVAPYYLMLHMIAAGPENLNLLFTNLKRFEFRIEHKSHPSSSDMWPFKGDYRVNVIPPDVMTGIDTFERVLKKVVRSYIAVWEKRKPEVSVGV